ncbi:hypothetical protein ACKI1I_02180 [Streptomyces turgidiscabies]|uniref:hypothetical protein n=1 Tax=Streptomyces TaxID=1883 RepID=UPI0002D35A72|nr:MULTISPECIES: hypothetical protein [Streptomyces]MDX3492295.1 hypothetical protein [Streptomyces turgidiscabies]GAQ69413.1 hypothetical protein T45_01137 [Streptomyces turgidiscabies]
MPRRRPSALRGEVSVRRQHRQRRASIDRISGSCAADIHRLELSRHWPESTAEALSQWRVLAYGPARRFAEPFPAQSCGLPGCGCCPGYFRDHLEKVLHALPRKSARELRLLVRSLDRTILDRARILRADHPDEPWWREQL